MKGPHKKQKGKGNRWAVSVRNNLL